jgi:CheY-like chemotaxis protein
MPATVLVVDDDPDFRGLAARMVAEVGLTVAAQAENAEEALAAAHRVRPDAALVDVRLPDRSGIDLGTELAALPWSPRVVLISSSSGVANLDMNGLTFVRKEDLPRVPLRQLLTSG